MLSLSFTDGAIMEQLVCDTASAIEQILKGRQMYNVFGEPIIELRGGVFVPTHSVWQETRHVWYLAYRATGASSMIANRAATLTAMLEEYTANATVPCVRGDYVATPQWGRGCNVVAPLLSAVLVELARRRIVFP